MLFINKAHKKSMKGGKSKKALVKKKKSRANKKSTSKKMKIGYYDFGALLKIRSPADFLLFFINPLRVENKIREREKEFPYWRKMGSNIEFISSRKDSYGLFIEKQKEPLILMRDIKPFTTSYLQKLGDLYMIRYYNAKRKMFMEISDHSEFFGTSYSDNIQMIVRPQEVYMNDYDMKMKIIDNCIRDLKRNSNTFWRYSIIDKYLKILEERRDKIKNMKNKIMNNI